MSGALDRLHSEKDPGVKYDVNRKVWIYLHRNRTEDEFGEIPAIRIQEFYALFLALLIKDLCLK